MARLCRDQGLGAGRALRDKQMQPEEIIKFVVCSVSSGALHEPGDRAHGRVDGRHGPVGVGLQVVVAGTVDELQSKMAMRALRASKGVLMGGAEGSRRRSCRRGRSARHGTRLPSRCQRRSRTTRRRPRRRRRGGLPAKAVKEVEVAEDDRGVRGDDDVRRRQQWPSKFTVLELMDRTPIDPRANWVTYWLGKWNLEVAAAAAAAAGREKKAKAKGRRRDEAADVKSGGERDENVRPQKGRVAAATRPKAKNKVGRHEEFLYNGADEATGRLWGRKGSGCSTVERDADARARASDERVKTER